MKHLYLSRARLLPFIIGVLLFAACKKDRPNTPTPLPVPPGEQPAAKLLKIEREGSPYPIEQYEYNEQGLLSKRINGMAVTSPTSFFYNADKKPVMAKTILVYDNVAYLTYKFYYANERLDKLELINTGYDPNNTKPYTIYKFLYKDNRLFQTIMYIGEEEESNIAIRTTSQYDINGDVKLIMHETRDADANTYHFSSEVIFEYDNKINPLKKQAELLKGFGMPSSPNNITKEIWKEGDNRKTTQVVTRSYTYNSKGLPLTAIEKYDFPEDPGEPPTTENIKYTYQ